MRYSKKLFVWLAAFACVLCELNAQDLHYADIQSMNMWYNQSLKMNRNSDVRLNYRDIKYQSLIAFRTGSGLANFILSKKNKEFDRDKGYLNLTMGGAFDQSNQGIFKHSTGLLGLSYAQPLSEDKLYIAAGFQGSITRSSFGVQGMLFQDQFDQYGQLPSGTRDPLQAGRSYNWFSLNAGLSLFNQTEINEWYVGVSMRHINRPFMDEQKTLQYKLAPTASIQAGYTVKSDDDIFGVYWISNFKAQAYEHVVGLKLMKKLNGQNESEQTAIGAGIALRMRDAIIPNIQLVFGKTNIGFHYDVNISGLQATGARRQGFELALARNF